MVHRGCTGAPRVSSPTLQMAGPPSGGAASHKFDEGALGPAAPAGGVDERRFDERRLNGLLPRRPCELSSATLPRLRADDVPLASPRLLRPLLPPGKLERRSQ